LGLGDVSVQRFGEENEVMIRFEEQPGGEEAQKAAQIRVEKALQEAIEGVSIRSTAFIGPKVSAELARDGTLAVALAVIAVLIYIWFRFEWQFGVGAVIALVRDVTLTVGFFSLTRLEFNLSIIAALLTIVGYSLNDTVVVYDRIRENIRKFRRMPLVDLLDRSINDTLSRTIMTSLTTLLALFALFFFGGAVIRGFTAAMIWGIFVGTYSSIFIASPVLLFLDLKRSAFFTDEETARP
ncbi:MAG: protein translocase subunit SecF, partial [Alphaproteobacteria bacterium]